MAAIDNSILPLDYDVVTPASRTWCQSHVKRVAFARVHVVLLRRGMLLVWEIFERRRYVPNEPCNGRALVSFMLRCCVSFESRDQSVLEIERNDSFRWSFSFHQSFGGTSSLFINRGRIASIRVFRSSLSASEQD